MTTTTEEATVARGWAGRLYASESAARLSLIIAHAAEELYDAATEPDSAQMWEDARAIASRILAACPM